MEIPDGGLVDCLWRHGAGEQSDNAIASCGLVHLTGDPYVNSMDPRKQ